MPERTDYYQPELTLPDILKRAVVNYPDLYIAFYDKNCNLTFQTYKELLAEASMIAAGFHNLGLKKGDKVIIATRANRETIQVLWGCFLMGLIPTILQPPATFSGENPAYLKLVKVNETLNNPFIIVNYDIKGGTRPGWNIRQKADLSFNGMFPEPDLSPDDLAFIQFSSGSTGESKGIMLTHNNLMVNMDAIRIGLDVMNNDKFSNWMPLFHDMGLICYHLTPIYSLVNQSHVETLDFILNPGLWLNLISNERITITGTTNFGLVLLLRYLNRGKQVPDWDFSHLKALLNGAEPISVKIMQDFVDSLIPFSLRPEVMMPGYGLAEATLVVTLPSLRNKAAAKIFNGLILDREHKALEVDPSDPAGRLITEVGVPLNDVEVRIVNDNDDVVAEGTAGHIQIRGKSVTKGYYQNPRATSSAFCGEWLRTGDIGFFYKGSLYISGRFKDIIFKNGIHYFANDLEELACTISEIKYGKVCLGGTTDSETGEERVIVFIAGLQKEKARETFRKLRTLLRRTAGIAIDMLILLKLNEIPKNSSGKLQRYKLMQRYLTGDFNDRVIMADKNDFL